MFRANRSAPCRELLRWLRRCRRVGACGLAAGALIGSSAAAPAWADPGRSAAAPTPSLSPAARAVPSGDHPPAATAQGLGGPLSAADLQPSERERQAWLQLSQDGSCAAGPSADQLRTGGGIQRFEAALLLRRCLLESGSATDPLQELSERFSPELSVLEARADALDTRLSDLERRAFSTTTRLRTEATFVIGANRFTGSATDLVNSSRSEFGASTFNYDLKLILNTSFTGKDLLVMRLRAGNFDRTSNSFYGAGPSALSQLEVAFQERSAADRVAINRLYYQVPIGTFTFTLGALVEQDTMLAIWPWIYPSEPILDLMTFAGAIGALNLNLGTGAGLWWQSNGWAISVNTIAANGKQGNPASGGIGGAASGSTSTVQLGYSGKQWAMAATYSHVQNGNGLIPYGTNFVLTSFLSPGSTSAYGIGGYWQPLRSGWLPSISAGYGLNTSRYADHVDADQLASISQSWSVGLQWQDAIAKGNVLGLGVGQPTYAIRLGNGEAADDGNWVWEGWYQIRLSDHLNLTPGLFYLSRPLGADTPAGRSVQQLGLVVKTSFRF